MREGFQTSWINKKFKRSAVGQLRNQIGLCLKGKDILVTRNCKVIVVFPGIKYRDRVWFRNKNGSSVIHRSKRCGEDKEIEI